MARRVLFLGSKSLGVRILQSMVNLAPGGVCAAITIDDSGDSRSELSSLMKVASEASIPLHIARDSKHAADLIRAEAPDWCFVACWYWLVPASLLRSVPGGFVGIHNSLLPKYRGGSPLVWALMNSEPEVGVSFFSFREGVDDGPIWLQARIAVGPGEYIGQVLERVEHEALRVFRDGFPLILNGELTPREQDHEVATYCAQRCPEDGEIDWSRPAAHVFDFIRAQSRPYPGAFTFLDEKKLTVLRASRVPSRYDGTPGQAARLDGDGVIVVCGGASALRLDEVDPGGGPIAAGRVIRTVRIRFPRYPRGAAPEVFTAGSIKPS